MYRAKENKISICFSLSVTPSVITDHMIDHLFQKQTYQNLLFKTMLLDSGSQSVGPGKAAWAFRDTHLKCTFSGPTAYSLNQAFWG